MITSKDISPLTDADRVNVLIVDDTMFERASSKKVELLSRVYNHAKKAYKYRFRLLTLGWSDGNTFFSINSCLFSTKNEKNRINEVKDFDRRSTVFHKRNLMQTKATAVAQDLLKVEK